MKQVQLKTKILIILGILIVIGFIVNQIVATLILTGEETMSVDWTKSKDQEISLTYSVSKEWDEPGFMKGAEYDFEIHNNSDQEIMDWMVEIPVSVRMNPLKDGDIWNVEMSEETGKIIFTPKDYVNKVLKHDAQTFGLIAVTDGEFLDGPATLSYTRIYNPYQMPSFLVLVCALFFWILFFVHTLSEYNEKKKAIQREEQNRQIILQSMSTFVNFIDAKDPYTKGHSRRVAIVATELARKYGLDETECQHVYYAGLLHDSGKISVPDSILKKVGILTREEYAEMQQHPAVGGQMLKDFTSIEGIREGAMSHHERYDGNGYPNGLKGEEIPLFGRLICVADTYDAMARDRCYRKHLDKEKILSEFRDHSGTQFDPKISRIMIDLILNGRAEELTKEL